MVVIDDSKKILEAEACVFELGVAYTTSIAVRCAIQLGIPDVISSHGTPPTLPQLLSQLSIPPEKSPQFYRLMRLLVHNNVFTLEKNDGGETGYGLTFISEALTNKSQGSFSENALLMTNAYVVTPCLSMADWFRNSPSPTPFEAMHGMNLYEYLGMHPDLNATYNATMGICAGSVINHVLKDLKPMLDGFKTLVDVGGGNGTVAKAISEAAPHLECTVYDLQQVISDIKDTTHDIKFVAGNMFEFVPSADIIHLKSVLMDWSDQECLKVLKRCREAISRNESGGKVIIVDSVIDSTKVDSESLKSQSSLDVFTMSVVSGKVERTETEWKELILEAGFTSYNITPSFRFHSIIQVFP